MLLNIANLKERRHVRYEHQQIRDSPTVTRMEEDPALRVYRVQLAGKASATESREIYDQSGKIQCSSPLKLAE